MVIGVKLVDGTRLMVRRNNIVGCCRCHLHPGKLTKRLMLEHDCIGKRCGFFEKNEHASYWVGQQVKAKNKHTARNHQRAVQYQKERIQEHLHNIQADMQHAFNRLGYTVEIVRIERLSKTQYRVFYVSDNPFADGNRFPDFFAEMHRRYPSWRLDLRHIKDVDGHFVTREEYHRKNR